MNARAPPPLGQLARIVAQSTRFGFRKIGTSFAEPIVAAVIPGVGGNLFRGRCGTAATTVRLHFHRIFMSHLNVALLLSNNLKIAVIEACAYGKLALE